MIHYPHSVRSGDMPRADPITPRPGGRSALARRSSSLAIAGVPLSRHDRSFVTAGV